MARLRVLLLLALSLSAPVCSYAQPPADAPGAAEAWPEERAAKKAIPIEGDRDKFVRLTLPGKVEEPQWQTFPFDVLDSEELDGGKRLVVSGPPGEYFAVAWYKSEGKAQIRRFRVRIGDPPAPAPVPPAPGPGPGPGPAPSPLPVPGLAEGLRVVLVSETSARLPAAQAAALDSARVAEYLNAHCAKDASGRASWRLYDPDVTLAREDPTMASLWAACLPKVRAPDARLPVVFIFNGPAGFPVPLPADEAGLLDLLQRYGGK